VKARIAPKHKLSAKQREDIRNYAAEEYEKRAEKDRQRSALVFILASACALRRNPKRHFGAKRLTEHMADLQEVYELLDGYGEDAAWKCVQILEDAGVNMDEWKKMLRELFKEDE
jgi:hypothetical protein